MTAGFAVLSLGVVVMVADLRDRRDLRANRVRREELGAEVRMRRLMVRDRARRRARAAVVAAGGGLARSK